MSKVAHGGVHVSQTSAEMRLFSENLHVVTSSSWYNFVETRRIGWTNGKLCSKLHIVMYSCVKRCVQTHLFLIANMSHSAFAESKTMETFHPDMPTYGKSCTRTRPRKSKRCRVISWSVVVVSRSSWSSWSVVLRGWCLYSMVVMHTYLLRHMAGENRGQCLDKCTGVG